MVFKTSSSRFVALGLVACGVMGSGVAGAEAPAGGEQIKANTIVAAADKSPAGTTLTDAFHSLERSSDCSEFKSNFKSFYKQARAEGALSEEKRDRIKMVIALSCSQSFRSCNPEFCTTNSVDTAAAAPAPRISPAVVVAEPAEKMKSGVAMLRGMETDKMAWLGNPMSCEQLSEQVTIRYQPFGPYASLPPQIKDEAKQVIKTACSERFQNCRFSQCDTIAAADLSLAPVKKNVEKKSVKMVGNKIVENRAVLAEATPAVALLEANWGVERPAVIEVAAVSPDLGTVELKAAAEQLLNKQIAAYRSELKKRIRDEVELDQKENRTWQVIAMYEEMGSSVKRRAEKKELSDEDEDLVSSFVTQEGNSQVITVRGSEKPAIKDRKRREVKNQRSPEARKSSYGTERRWGQPKLNNDDSLNDPRGALDSGTDSPWADKGNGKGWSDPAEDIAKNSRQRLSAQVDNNSGVTWGGQSGGRDHGNSGDRGGPVPVPNLY